MIKKITLPQLKKYDINQKVIRVLADTESRAILFSVIKRGRMASGLSAKLNIPLSSVYKKLAELEDLALIEVEARDISEKGRRLKIYRSRISRAVISIQRPEPVLHLTPN